MGYLLAGSVNTTPYHMSHVIPIMEQASSWPRLQACNKWANAQYGLILYIPDCYSSYSSSPHVSPAHSVIAKGSGWYLLPSVQQQNSHRRQQDPQLGLHSAPCRLPEKHSVPATWAAQSWKEAWGTLIRTKKAHDCYLSVLLVLTSRAYTNLWTAAFPSCSHQFSHVKGWRGQGNEEFLTACALKKDFHKPTKRIH